MTTITFYQGDITKQDVDAIVNAANEGLSGGGGVDGAIHQAAGPELKKECQAIGGCKVGEAKITEGYDLPAKYIIHTVGPKYEDEKAEVFLKSAYLSSLRLAKENNIKTIAFPAISTGAFGYPKEEAAEVAVNTVKNYVKNNPGVFDEIRFVLFDEEAFYIYRDLISQ